MSPTERGGGKVAAPARRGDGSRRGAGTAGADAAQELPDDAAVHQRGPAIRPGRRGYARADIADGEAGGRLADPRGVSLQQFKPRISTLRGKQAVSARNIAGVVAWHRQRECDTTFRRLGNENRARSVGGGRHIMRGRRLVPFVAVEAIIEIEVHAKLPRHGGAFRSGANRVPTPF